MRTALIVGLVLLITGCAQQGVEIIRTIGSPVVVPAPNLFKLTAGVRNFDKVTWSGEHGGELWLNVFGYYNPTEDTSGNPANAKYFEEWYEIGPLPAEDSFTIVDQVIHALPVQNPPATACVSGTCNGHLHLVLFEVVVPGAFEYPLDGPNTDVSVTWAKSGDLGDMQVVDESD